MTEARQIRVGVAGVGHLGRHHARIWAAMPGARLVAVADRDVERAREVASAYGCEALPSHEDLVSRVEAASVAVPTVHHREVAESLLRGGVDVLVEKPIAASLEDARALNATGAAAGRLVMVGHTERFHPAVRALARAVDAPRFLEIHRLAGFSSRSTDVDVVLDLMIHDLDLLLHLDGTEPVSIDAVGVAVLTDKVDIANARIRLASGCVANLTASRISKDKVRRIRIFQSRTYLACDTLEGTVDRYRVRPRPDALPEIEAERLPVEEGEPLALELQAFLESVRTRKPPPIDGVQAERALRLALEVKDAISSPPGPP